MAGQIGWVDLTVDDASGIRDFYEQVTSWTSDPVSMGDYSDFSMCPSGSSEGVAGICHARGSNADLPVQWLIYITVDDVDASIEKCLELGGAVISGPKDLAGGRFCVIQDPAGAVAALYQQ